MNWIKNIRYACLAMLPWAMLSCEPIENRDEMPAPLSPSQLKFTVTQDPEHDNTLYLKSETKGVIPFWNYGTGVSYKQNEQVNNPFKGDWWIKYTGYSAGGAVTDSVKIVISENDAEYFKDPMWQLLTNGAEGKTWVWATDNPNKGYVRGIGPYNPDEFDPMQGFGWWGTEDHEKGEFTLDLNKGFHFIKTPEAGPVEKGVFSFNPVTGEIKFTGATMFNQEADNATSTYRIGKLTEDELIFCQVYSTSQRPYYFKRKGYNFPK